MRLLTKQLRFLSINSLILRFLIPWSHDPLQKDRHYRPHRFHNISSSETQHILSLLYRWSRNPLRRSRLLSEWNPGRYQIVQILLRIPPVFD